MVHPVRGLVLHVEEGTETGTDGWFHNPTAQASAHFGIAKNGTLHQWVDTDDKSWAEAMGNPNWWSVETEGSHTEPLTDAQVHMLGRLYGWLMTLPDKIPAQLAETPSGRGLGWHGMGGQAWGGHLSCPGDQRKAQRAAALASIGTATPVITAPPAPSAPISEVPFDMAALKTDFFPFPAFNAGGEVWFHIPVAFAKLSGEPIVQGSNPDRDHTLFESVSVMAQADGDGTLITARRLTSGHPVSGIFVKWVE